MTTPSPQVVAAVVAGLAAIVVAAIGILPTRRQPPAAKEPPRQAGQSRASAAPSEEPPSQHNQPTALATSGGVAVSGVSAGRDANVVVNADRPRAKGKAEVSDVIVDDHRESFDALVDFRVTNRGELPVSISRVRFTVLDVSQILTAGALSFSTNYDIDISSLSRRGRAQR
jgi:hypothetical protein